MEKKINAIVEKARKMLKYNLELKNILKTEPYARVQRKRNGTFEVMSIYFQDEITGDVLYIQPLGITLYGRKKNNYTDIVKYKNYDELLALD